MSGGGRQPACAASIPPNSSCELPPGAINPNQLPTGQPPPTTFCSPSRAGGGLSRRSTAGHKGMRCLRPTALRPLGHKGGLEPACSAASGERSRGQWRLRGFELGAAVSVSAGTAAARQPPRPPTLSVLPAYVFKVQPILYVTAIYMLIENF